MYNANFSKQKTPLRSFTNNLHNQYRSKSKGELEQIVHSFEQLPLVVRPFAMLSSLKHSEAKYFLTWNAMSQKSTIEIESGYWRPRSFMDSVKKIAHYAGILKNNDILETDIQKDILIGRRRTFEK